MASVWALQPPGWWPLLLLVPLALVAAWWWRRRRRRLVSALLGHREAEILGVRVFERSRAVLAVGSVGMIVLAMLRPVSPGREAQLAPDVLLCVDVSLSMAAGDAPPSRFEQLRQQVHELLANAPGSRFALLAFAGEVAEIAPLTGDHEAVGWLLDELLPGAVLGGGSDLGAVIERGLASLDRSDTAGSLLLLTDGEDFGEDAVAAARRAAAAGHRIDAVGYGSRAGGKIVIDGADGDAFLQDGSGNDVITRLDEAGLRAITEAGGGELLLARATGSLVPLWRDRLVPFAARRSLEAGIDDVLPRFQWPLLAALLMAMLLACLPERRR